MLTKYNLKMPHEIFSGEDALENLKTIVAGHAKRHFSLSRKNGIKPL